MLSGILCLSVQPGDAQELHSIDIGAPGGVTSCTLKTILEQDGVEARRASIQNEAIEIDIGNAAQELPDLEVPARRRDLPRRI